MKKLRTTMASTSGSPLTTEKNGLLIEQFISVTGSSRDKAYKMLEVCNWNLEMAINMHVDTDFAENDGEQTKSVNIEDSSVRAPIPQSRAILVEEDLTFHYGLRGRKRRPHSVFDGFRDFQAEARIQELSTDTEEETSKKRRTLEDLFRPPLDLMHRGSFESARDYGQSSNRWLLVNIQNSFEFSCQVLNRDVWSNPTVKSLVDKYFVFWQVYSDSTDGERYMQFYKPVEFPYVAVIDPRTGEKLVEWHQMDSTVFCKLVEIFLKEYSSPNGTTAELSSTASPSKFSLLDQSEDDQLKAALAASLKESSLANDENESDLETFESDSESTNDKLSKVTIENSDHSCDTIDVVGCAESGDNNTDAKVEESWKDFLGSEDDPNTDLVLRLPDGKREQITWPCTTKIKSLLLYTNELGFDSDKYELVTNFPRRNLSDLDVFKTLKEVDLFPREIIIIQQKT